VLGAPEDRRNHVQFGEEKFAIANLMCSCVYLFWVHGNQNRAALLVWKVSSQSLAIETQMESLPNTPGFRVLILEDQEIDSEVAIEVLRSCGAVQVVHVTNGREGLSIQSSGSNAIDVVVSDLQMPGMDGLEFLRKVSSLHPSIAIV
jgi:PleD family two-component response regulator